MHESNIDFIFMLTNQDRTVADAGERLKDALAAGDGIWYANHQDPAFAERTKRQFGHHMPMLYTPKIISGWEAYFKTGQLRDRPAEKITPFGFRCPIPETREPSL